MTRIWLECRRKTHQKVHLDSHMSVSMQYSHAKSSICANSHSETNMRLYQSEIAKLRVHLQQSGSSKYTMSKNILFFPAGTINLYATARSGQPDRFSLVILRSWAGSCLIESSFDQLRVPMPAIEPTIAKEWSRRPETHFLLCALSP